MELMVSALRINGDDNLDIELIDPGGGDLPPFSPGAHIDVRTPSGALRQYSLCGPVSDRRVYRICVRREKASRGGSRSLHGELRIRAKVEVSGPRNLFPLPEAERYVLLSAGIGITPIISMARHLLSAGSQFELHHFERSRSRVAFDDELTSGPLSAMTTVHVGDEGVSFRNTAPRCLSDADPGTAVVACGPNGFLDLLTDRLRAGGWLEGQVHTERFRLDAPPADAAATDLEVFEVEVASTGQRFSVAPNETIAGVLQLNGVSVDLSCEQGMCGACLTKVIAGVPDHRDIVLSDAEKAANDRMTICCSRSASPLLVLGI